MHKLTEDVIENARGNILRNRLESCSVLVYIWSRADSAPNSSHCISRKKTIFDSSHRDIFHESAHVISDRVKVLIRRACLVGYCFDCRAVSFPLTYLFARNGLITLEK